MLISNEIFLMIKVKNLKKKITFHQYLVLESCSDLADWLAHRLLDLASNSGHSPHRGALEFHSLELSVEHALQFYI